ncbi:MAG: hypothetical protein ACOY3I_08115 [Verrucomicrobiota bacterium]
MNLRVSKLFFILTPYGIVIITVLLSFLAWVTPDFGFFIKGFEAIALTPKAILYFITWYSLILFFSWLGFLLGKRYYLKTSFFKHLASLDDGFIYLAFSIFGSIGGLYALYYIWQNIGWTGIIHAISTSQANILKIALYENYSIGIFSLRYLTILSGGLAIYRMLSKISFHILDFFNLFLLLLISGIASRLSFVAACIIGVGLWIINDPRETIKIPISKSILAILVLFILFSAYNSARNAGFYSEKRGIDSFYVAGASEILSYLGTPFQGSLTAGEHFNSLNRGGDIFVLGDIDDRLTTNSAFAELTKDYGYYSFFIIAVASFCSASMMGFLRYQLDTYLALIYFVLLYCFSELWRIFMFNKGIVITLLIFSLVLPVGMGFLKALFARK